MSETEKVAVSTELLEQQKAKAVEYLRMLGIFKPYIQGFKQSDKLTYTKAELLREAKSFSLYYGRMELMPEYMRKKFDDFVRKVKVYEQEKGVAL